MDLSALVTATRMKNEYCIDVQPEIQNRTSFAHALLPLVGLRPWDLVLGSGSGVQGFVHEP